MKLNKTRTFVIAAAGCAVALVTYALAAPAGSMSSGPEKEGPPISTVPPNVTPHPSITPGPSTTPTPTVPPHPSITPLPSVLAASKHLADADRPSAPEHLAASLIVTRRPPPSG